MNGEKKAGRRGAGGGGAGGGDGSAKANAVEREGARVDWKVNLTWLSPAVQAQDSGQWPAERKLELLCNLRHCLESSLCERTLPILIPDVNAERS